MIKSFYKFLFIVATMLPLLWLSNVQANTILDVFPVTPEIYQALGKEVSKDYTPENEQAKACYEDICGKEEISHTHAKNSNSEEIIYLSQEETEVFRNKGYLSESRIRGPIERSLNKQLQNELLYYESALKALKQLPNLSYPFGLQNLDLISRFVAAQLFLTQYEKIISNSWVYEKHLGKTTFDQQLFRDLAISEGATKQEIDFVISMLTEHSKNTHYFSLNNSVVRAKGLAALTHHFYPQLNYEDALKELKIDLKKKLIRLEQKGDYFKVTLQYLYTWTHSLVYDNRHLSRVESVFLLEEIKQLAYTDILSNASIRFSIVKNKLFSEALKKETLVQKVRKNIETLKKLDKKKLIDKAHRTCEELALASYVSAPTEENLSQFQNQVIPEATKASIHLLRTKFGLTEEEVTEIIGSIHYAYPKPRNDVFSTFNFHIGRNSTIGKSFVTNSLNLPKNERLKNFILLSAFITQEKDTFTTYYDNITDICFAHSPNDSDHTFNNYKIISVSNYSAKNHSAGIATLLHEIGHQVEIHQSQNKTFKKANKCLSKRYSRTYGLSYANQYVSEDFADLFSSEASKSISLEDKVINFCKPSFRADIINLKAHYHPLFNPDLGDHSSSFLRALIYSLNQEQLPKSCQQFVNDSIENISYPQSTPQAVPIIKKCEL